jgi:antitoxin component YwqK of YwqJK toxin-antitoxin module
LDESTFSDGKKTGQYVSYHENGQLWKKGEFDDTGKKIGTWEYYNEAGVLNNSFKPSS